MTSHNHAALPPMLAKREDLQQEATVSALSSDQQTILKTIESYEDTRLVNVHGPSGAGKTFLGWVLDWEYNHWSYYPWIPRPPIDEMYVIMDNVASKRVASRRVREFVDFGDAEVIVALSREPVPEIHTSHRLPKDTTG
jgi:hypothetical protein